MSLNLTANDMLGNKLIDGIVKEPLGGAHTDVKAMAHEIKRVIITNFNDLNKCLHKTELISASINSAPWVL
jgi:acetyl-CoA carboxylase carboxyl transferase subunit alpha